MDRNRAGYLYQAPSHILNAIFLLVLACALVAGRPVSASPPNLAELSIEELMNIEVTTVSKRSEPRSEAPAAVYVITQEDIRRSGVTSIPEALRLAPGVEVAKIDSNKWAIGIRGFASRLARSVLVLIDGRSVYTPLFAGTYWEVQDTLLDDVDRIEVIRGPGGTLWGANAFNGVINIITKNAKDTQGGLTTAGGGNEEQGFAATRYGGRLGEHAFYRVYGKFFNRDGGFNPSGDAYDGWHMGRGGFRIDWDATAHDALTLQGDLYAGETGQRSTITQYSPPIDTVAERNADLSGGNVLGRWRRTLSSTSEVSLQVYYDHTFRREPTFRDELDTVDLEAQHRVRLPWRQQLVWGFNYRFNDERTGAVPTITLVPPNKSFALYSGFLQDEVELVEDTLRLTIGSKFEHNDFSGFEYQPSGRLLWTPRSWQMLWASISRAVRTPSRIEDGLVITASPLNQSACQFGATPCVFPRVVGDGGFHSEKVLAYELGHRIQPADPVFFDTAIFYNRYTGLESLEIRETSPLPVPEAEPPPPHSIVPYQLRNKLDGESYGFEVAADALPTAWLRLHATYAYLQTNLQRQSDSTDPISRAAARDSPHNQFSLRSSIDLPTQWELDALLRYVEGLPHQQVEGYSSLDVRVAKHVTEHIELAAVGQNLLQDHHSEFGGGTQVQRGAYGQVRWQW
jgi:iron complex outermembrane receptor protein